MINVMQSPLTFLTVEDYLDTEKHSKTRHEYVDGRIFAMAGASEEHNLIAGNLYTALRSNLRGTSCRTFVSDMKVKVSIQKADIFYYPDLLVTCDPDDNERYYKTSPNLIVEVLSNSTETTDKREKRLNYQTIESLQEYVLISQDEIRVEVYRRNDQNNWSVETLGKDDKLQLNSVGLTLTMAEIYEDVNPEKIATKS
ncbi:MAG: Uma2 family endonuclease [Spirulinaceae cyanobacterium]